MRGQIEVGDLVTISGTFPARYVDPMTGYFHEGHASFRDDVALEVVRVRYPYCTVAPSARGYKGVKYLIDLRETEPEPYQPDR